MSVLDEYRPLMRALSQLQEHKAKIVLGLISASLVGAVTTANAKVVQLLVDQVFTHREVTALYHCVFLVIGIQVFKGIFLFCSRYYMHQVGHFASSRIRQELYEKMVRLPIRFYQRHKTGDVISRITNDVAVLQFLLALVSQSIIEVFIIAFGIGFMFWVDFKLAVVTFVVLPVLFVLVQKFSSRLRSIGSQMQLKMGEINSFVQESVLGIREIQSFGMEDRMVARFLEVNQTNYKVNMKSTKYHSLTQPIVEMCHALGMCLVIWYGSVAVLEGKVTPGHLMQFIVCLGMIFHPIKKLTEVNNYTRQSVAAAERIFELIDAPVEIESAPGAVVLDHIEGDVRFDAVGFRYTKDDRPVIKDLSVHARPGELIALVGHSGAGKSTLVNLIPRFYDVDSGRILIDGHDVRQIDLRSLRSFFGVVPQETILFAGSIEENIRFSKPKATEAEVYQAARDANALEFIEKLPMGFKTEIGERGIKLSGGQKQRIAIARAILKDPRILILDEATSSLDSESEKLVQDALDRLMKGRTTFVIAHRLSTITKADRILVLDEGRIKEMGNHEQLYRQQGIYHRLCLAQFKAA